MEREREQWRVVVRKRYKAKEFGRLKERGEEREKGEQNKVKKVAKGWDTLLEGVISASDTLPLNLAMPLFSKIRICT
ncbi:unnamed protein product [Lupinus luteus]|uniref:Uncharacterized protein n=1 Tax=Lupinus luteus TaxID=3873 RepID=A0AAV1XEP5_LUPLU